MQLAQENPAMQQAWGVIQEMSADEREREAAEAAEKARRDMVSRIRCAETKARDEGRKEGHADGLVKGRTEGREEVAKNLISMHLPDEMIIKATGLSPELIVSLRLSHTQMQ